ncbi:MAG: 2TM domain-containing protein [Sandaracinaceae bacterium]
MSDGRNYSDDEVEAIFKRAFERQASEGEGYTHDELAAAAREMGLDDEALARAVAETQEELATDGVRQELAAAQRLAFFRHVAGFSVVCGAAVALFLAGLTGVWAVWFAAFWGAGLAMHGVSAFAGPNEKQVRQERGRRNRRARRIAEAEARRARKKRKRADRRNQADKRRQAEEELERVIEEGVAQLLGAAAKHLSGAGQRMNAQRASTATDPTSAFGKYVARQKAKQRGEAAPRTPPSPHAKPSRPQVRVEAEREPEDVEVEARRKKRRRA